MNVKRNVTEVPLFKNYRNTLHLFVDRRLKGFPFYERNASGWKELSQVLSEQTSDPSAFTKVCILL
jgi:hypothetical protein